MAGIAAPTSTGPNLEVMATNWLAREGASALKAASSAAPGTWIRTASNAATG